MKLRDRIAVLFAISALLGAATLSSAAPLLLRQPALSATRIAFSYGGDLWIALREGGDATRLTFGTGEESNPCFSPDGTLVAFTGEYDGNPDVYVVPVSGGTPRRLTYHPAPETVVGFTPDGKNVLFNSNAKSFYHFAHQIDSVPVTGGFPTPLPLAIGFEASLSPDGSHVAYVPHGRWQPAWKRYRGGQTTPIWIASLKDSSVEKIPRDGSNDSNPMWVGDTVYFLSDRGGPVSLYAYDTRTKRVSEALRSDGLDFKSASAGPGAVVIEQFGSLKLFDLQTRSARTVTISVTGDLPQTRPRFATVKPARIRNFGISPSGQRALFEAWGEILSVPTDKGDVRNLTRSPAVADRDPAWSPDGKSVAYFSDQPGEYELQIRPQSGQGEVRHVSLGDPPSFFYSPVWSPDSRKIAFFDKRLKLWYVDLDKNTRTLLDTDAYGGFGPSQFNQAWSPDSQWIAYTRLLTSGLHAVFVFSLQQGKSFQVTDGMSDTLFPVFDKEGKYLYFTASTDIALGAASLDMSSNARPVTRSVYVAVLGRDAPSPLAPESDEEGKESKEDKKAEAQKEKGKDDARKAKTASEEEKPPLVVKLDVDGIGQRILSLPIPARNYVAMAAGKAGILFLSEAPMVLGEGDFPNLRQTLQKFDLSKRKLDKLLDEVNDFAVSFDGSKILYRKDEQWATAATDEPPMGGEPKPGLGPLKLDAMQVYVEPKAMWRQVYDETWRIERDFFYDPGYHGLDLAKARKRYEPYLEGIASREDLTYLFEEALGELTVGHMFVRGGDQPEAPKVKGGLLGADYALENGRYRVARIYGGENWNPGLQAPLTQPGVNVKVGDYILAVNGRELHSSDNIYGFFEETAGRQVGLRIGPSPDGKGARDVTVVPVEGEGNLRRFAWIEGNRRKVDQMTGGRVAYVYLPDTGYGGYSNFNRYFFAQVGKEGVIVDERFNEGGQLADYVIDYLRRPLMSRVTAREGADWSNPSEAIYGPKAIIINEMAGSGGDALPWYFRKAGLGPLVGKRTWGGLVGIGGYPELIDGGTVTAPRAAIYGLGGDWEVENRGVPPDVEVDLDPAAFRAGHDAQLEKAVEIVMQQLKEHPLPQYSRPPYPNYHENDGLGRDK
jgi:tricorn protease